jgi:hypothetical protein
VLEAVKIFEFVFGVFLLSVFLFGIVLVLIETGLADGWMK